MMRKPNIFLTTFLLSVTVLLATTGVALAAFGQPSLSQYTSTPTFTTNAEAPNIMVILDNSGSMNFNAYGTYPGDGGTVIDEPFTGAPYGGMETYQISTSADDAEEGTATGSVTYYTNGDLDMGGFSNGSNDSVVGLRFQNVSIPQGTTIHSAYITFQAYATNSVTTNILIEGEASDNAMPFSATADNIKNRTPTTATVTWSNVQSWTSGQDYPSESLVDIVQEIVNRPGWTSGNAMAFRFTGIPGTDNKRDARSYDNSQANAPKLTVVYHNKYTKRYYGYFSPDYFYYYNSGTFEARYKKIQYDYNVGAWNVETMAGSGQTLTDASIVSQRLWDGNWLNWLCMRRVDVLRKVLMGGLATSRTGGGNQVNIGETPAQSSRVFKKRFDSSAGSPVSPYHGNYRFRMEDGYIYLDGTNTRYTIRVQKDASFEPESFFEGNLAGVLQRVGDKARWGNIWFNDGTGSNQSGGTVEHNIGTNVTSIITDLQNTKMDTWTPLAEAYYVAIQYFRQQDPDSGLDYSNSAVPNSNLDDDPYYNSKLKLHVPCAKSFVILLTDGLSTKDAMIPSNLKNWDASDYDGYYCTESNCAYPSGGSDYLDDLALYARTEDLRPDLDDPQNLILYAIHAFDKNPDAQALLKAAARNGGFDDRNDNGLPDLPEEYDKNGDGVPDTFFEADDGYAIEAKLLKAIASIMERATSGTAASVLATNSEGEGNMVQAYFRPLVQVQSGSGLDEANWLGYLQSLWVDSKGNLYEDTDDDGSGNKIFTPGPDRPIVFFNDGDDDTGFYYADVPNTAEPTVKPLDELKPIFEVGERLSVRDPDTRRIFTFIDADRNGIADDPGDDPLDAGGDVIAFDTNSAETIKPFLGVSDDTAWGDNGAGLGGTLDTRVDNIITWVRGTDVTGLRNRTLAGATWRLGDIVNSTPMTITRPTERFDIWYADESYRTYYDAFKDREGVIYVGANDGMLHAFASGTYDIDHRAYSRPTGVMPNGMEYQLGDELWAFIPQCVLPHLKWGAQINYTHTFLVDGKPRIFDAKILPDDTHYTDSDSDDNWGTILVMGMNLGAQEIGVYEDFNDGNGVVERTFYPTYICLDITEPRNPRLLWERTYPNLGTSYAVPTPFKVGEKWFLAFGSGPTAYNGTSDQGAYIYVADMKTGELLRDAFGPLDTEAFFATGASFDKNLNFNVDGVYLPNTYYKSNQWQGSIYKIAVPCDNCQWDEHYDPTQDTTYDTEPKNWYIYKLFDSDRPITAAPSISVEYDPGFKVDNAWIYFGTGRFISDDDKANDDQQYLYGIKDPYFNSRMYKDSYAYNYGAAANKTLSRSDLFAGDEITVTTSGRVLKDGALYGPYGYFNDMVDEIREKYDGWSYRLETRGSEPSERMISKPAIFSGIALFPTFTPTVEICKGLGTTNLYGLYYLTGTGYTKQIFEISAPDLIDVPDSGQQEIVEVKREKPELGAPPPTIGIHTGKEQGSTAYLQVSTGAVIEVNVQGAIYQLSTITDWWDRVYPPPPEN